MSDLLTNPVLDTTVSKDQMERDLKNVAGIKDKNEKLSWTRRQKKIEEMVDEMQPIVEKILELTATRQEYLDKIQVLRKQMVKECIHPKNSLVHKGTFIECKFCNAKLSIPRER
jgi:hypothetical protein